jgi:hypothetical protein
LAEFVWAFGLTLGGNIFASGTGVGLPSDGWDSLSFDKESLKGPSSIAIVVSLDDSKYLMRSWTFLKSIFLVYFLTLG